MAKSVVTLKFIPRNGHIECRWQSGKRRHHRSWPTREALNSDLGAFFYMRELGITPADIVTKIGAGEDRSTLLNLGTEGAVGFEEFCRKFYTPDRSAKPSWPWEKRRLEQILRDPRFAGRQLHVIRTRDIQEWFDAYSHSAKVKSDNTRAHMLKVVRNIFKLATRLHYLRENPAREVRPPPIPETRARALTHQEAVRLYHAADDSLRPWILLTLHEGLRPAEISRLTVAQVDLRERRITVLGSTVKNRPRELYAHDDLVPFLEAAAASLPNVPLVRDDQGNPAPFPRAAFDRAREKAKLAGITYYMLRHTFCTRLLETGTSSEELRAHLMGHKLAGMTSRYTHITPAQVRDAIRKLTSVNGSPDEAEMDNEVDNGRQVATA